MAFTGIVCSITKIRKSLTSLKVRNKIADRAGYVQSKNKCILRMDMKR